MITELVDQQTTPANPLKPHIQSIFNTTHQVIQAMDEVVWTINPKNDTLENLANYIFQYAQEYFQSTTTRCRLDLPAQLPDWVVPTEVRHNLFMAVKEALNNALKHAAAGEVRIGLAVNEGKISITIADDGRGFVPDAADPSRNGLRNMRERLEAIGGRLVLESRPGAGTTITMEAAVR